MLNSSIFYELFCDTDTGKEFNSFLVVNHNEQRNVYSQIASKLGIPEGRVTKPTSFINNHKGGLVADVVFIDEAHLLLTQGNQGYSGKNQLKDILKHAKVVVAMFDRNQVLTTEQIWEYDTLNHYIDDAKANDNYIQLKTQMRMQASEDVIKWIDDFTKNDVIGRIPRDKSYRISVLESIEELESNIEKLANNKNTSLSRMIATYDWEYVGGGKHNRDKVWSVQIGEWERPWNYQTNNKSNSKLAWAEQPHTIKEVGSTYTIQGFDLNYAGVILGPSIKFRNGKIIHDLDASCNRKATQSRTLSDGKKEKFGIELLKHEVRVLMTRGVNGLYIYACDDELRKELLKAQSSIWTDNNSYSLAAHIKI